MNHIAPMSNARFWVDVEVNDVSASPGLAHAAAVVATIDQEIDDEVSTTGTSPRLARRTSWTALWQARGPFASVPFHLWDRGRAVPTSGVSVSCRCCRTWPPICRPVLDLACTRYRARLTGPPGNAADQASRQDIPLHWSLGLDVSKRVVGLISRMPSTGIGTGMCVSLSAR